MYFALQNSFIMVQFFVFLINFHVASQLIQVRLTKTTLSGYSKIGHRTMKGKLPQIMG